MRVSEIDKKLYWEDTSVDGWPFASLGMMRGLGLLSMKKKNDESLTIFN